MNYIAKAKSVINQEESYLSDFVFHTTFLLNSNYEIEAMYGHNGESSMGAINRDLIIEYREFFDVKEVDLDGIKL